jgi:hypothetical protein
MKKTLLICGGLLITVALVLQILVPFTVNAQVQQGTPGSNSQQSSGSSGIKNPLNVNSIQDLISAALKFVVNLLAIAGVVYIIWTGFLFVKAQGNPKELETAKKSFFNAIIGMAIILGAWAIATAIANTINQVTNNNNVTLRAQ